jgi:hypothetical protein
MPSTVDPAAINKFAGYSKVDAWLETVRAGQKAGQDIASSWQRSFDIAISKIKGDLGQGMDFSKGLKDLTGGGGKGPLAPGANGPFENIYRLQAWLNDNSWGDIGQKFAGGDKGKAKQIVQDFQNGIFSPGVIGAIDVDQLANQAGMADLAAKSQEAFAKAIAAKAGTSTDIVDNLLGLKAETGKQSPQQIAIRGAMDSFAGNVETEVKGKDFAGKMIGYGDTIWGYAESGMIDRAKKSTAFQQAIEAMVAAAIAGALQ